MIERTYRTPGSLRLDLAIPAGSIDVETIDGEETHVVVDADDERSLEALELELRERGSGHELLLAAERRGVFGLVQIRIAGMSLGGGDYRVRVRCPHGADLALRTASADVDARGSFGGADVKTASGDLRIDDVASDASIKTVSGDTSVRSVGGRLTVTSVSGDLRFDDVAAAVTAKTVSGDLRVVVASGDVGITSVSGDIEVAVRQGSRLYVDANSVSGSLDSEVPLASLPSEGTDESPLVELRAKTVSGDFRVVRA